jgi:hypothetical protein
MIAVPIAANDNEPLLPHPVSFGWRGFFVPRPCVYDSNQQDERTWGQHIRAHMVPTTNAH